MQHGMKPLLTQLHGNQWVKHSKNSLLANASNYPSTGMIYSPPYGDSKQWTTQLMDGVLNAANSGKT
jgi:hypothetical protein